MEGFQVLPHNVFISRLSSYLSSLVTSWHLKGSTLFVGHTCMGVGSSPFTFPLGTGEFTGFHLHKKWMPWSCPRGGGGGGSGFLNDRCIIVFASIYCLILSIEIILSLCFDVYFGRKIALRSDLVFDLCVFVKSLNFWDLWQLITSILHCYQQSELIKVTNLFLHWFSLIAKIIWNHSLILFTLDCCFVTFKIALLKMCLL